jgi:serine/threonine protein phosphatase PrpC
LILRAVKATSVGRVRDHQEDAVEIFAPPDNTPQAQKGQLLIVADGMGGHNAGEVASEMALTTIRDVFYADPAPDLTANLRSALAAANEAIFNHSRQTAGQSGMGTTAAVMVVRQNQVQIANVGDSRAYVLRSGKLTQVTTDHSWVEEQVRAGVLTPEQARAHPQRNIITRALGTTPKVQPDFFDGVLNEGDVFLLCSDGLNTHVSDAQIQDVLLTMTSLDQAANRLIQLANDGGGSDNISVIVARVEPLAATAPLAAAAAPRPRSIPLLIGAVLGSLAGVALVAFLVIKIVGPTGHPTSTPTVLALATTPAPVATTPPSPVLTTPPVTDTPNMTATAAAISSRDGNPTSTIAPPPTTPAPATPARTQTPGGIDTPTSTPQTPPAPLAPVPIAPQERATGLTGRVPFAWEYGSTLGPGQAFEVRIWKEGQEHLGAAAATTALELTIDLDVAPGILNNKNAAGKYLWAVAVIERATGARIGRESEPRHFTYSPPPVCVGGACR